MMFNRKEYMKEYNKKYRINNIEKISKYQKEYEKTENGKLAKKKYNKSEKGKENQKRANISEKGKLRHLKFRKSDKWKEYHNKWQKEYAKTENGKANNRRSQFKRQTKMKEITNNLTYQEWLDILEKYNYKCFYCNTEFEIENMPTKDHIIPISKGGNNTKDNIVPSCKSCNSKKYDKILQLNGISVN